MPDVENISIEDVAGDGAIPPVGTTGELERQCRECDSLIGSDVECSECGALNPGRRIRRDDNRPKRERIREVESNNWNGRYTIYRNSDGSLSCTCLSFLFQRGVENGVGFTTCKHIRPCLDDQTTAHEGAENPSEWQLAALKRFGVEVNEHMTNAQAYFLFRDLLTKQGVAYREYKSLLVTHKDVSLLPVYSFGVEFEGFVRNRSALNSALQASGIPSVITGYDHSMSHQWKIATDSSIRGRTMDAMELVSPKLFGAEGFRHIEKVLTLWEETGADINNRCGTHVHIDAWNWESADMQRLAKVWASIEIPLIWYLVSPSRRSNAFCKPVNAYYLQRLMSNGDRVGDRYYSLNLEAFHRYKTIEFRIHNGTYMAKKVIPWIIFLLKLTDAVKRGLSHEDIPSPVAFDGVMNAVGMGHSSTSVIREARNYLYGRYRFWQEDAERHPSHLPAATPVDMDTLDETMARQLEEQRLERLGNRYYSRRQGMTEPDSRLPADHLQNLAARIPSSAIQIADMARTQMDGCAAWEVPSRRSDAVYRVELNDSERLTCRCRPFRTQGHCYHTVNVARYVIYLRQREALSTNAEAALAA